MAVLYQSPDLQLPWSSSAREDRLFAILAVIFLLITILSGIYIQTYVLPPQERSRLEKVPEKLVRIMQKKKEEPKPVEEKKPEEKKPEEKKPEEKKPEEKKPEEKKEVKPEDVKNAREKVKKMGLIKMQDDLAEMRQAFKPVAGVAMPMTNKGAQSLNVTRSVIMGKATATSGGIQTAALPSGSGVGSIGGREVTQVDSITLGGTSVDGGGGIGEAAEASSRDTVGGNRSEERIRAILDQNKGALYVIYNKALRQDPTLKGRVTFELVIEPDGFVSSCKIMASELNDTGLESKLVSRMKLIDFGAEKVETTTTRWAIDFLPY